MALVDSAEALCRHLRRAEGKGIFMCAVGPLLQIQEHEVNPFIFEVEADIREIREGGAASVKLVSGKPVPQIVTAKPTPKPVPVIAATKLGGAAKVLS